MGMLKKKKQKQTKLAAVNILSTLVYSLYVSISVGNVLRVQNQQSLFSLFSLHLWGWVCLQVEIHLPHSYHGH